MTWTIIAIAIVLVARLLYLMVRVNHNGTDECHYRQQAEQMADQGILSEPRHLGDLFERGRIQNWLAPPMRILYLYACAIAVKTTRAYRWTMLAAVSSAAGVLCSVLAAVVGYRLGGWTGATSAALLVGWSPLCLGLGRRVLVDVPAAATQLGVLAAATLGPSWWPAVTVALVVALLTRESTRTLAPGLAVAVAWFWRWDWQVMLAFGVAAPVYSVLLRLLIGRWPWQFPIAFVERVVRRIPLDPTHYAATRCAGGLHRLLVDLVLASPVVCIAACSLPNWLTVAALVMLIGYAAPWLQQQIRACLVVDLLLRIVVAVTLPGWALGLAIAVDVYVFQKAWLRGKLYDPTSYGMAEKLGVWR